MWLPLAIFSALTSASRRVLDKGLTVNFGNYGMGFIVNAFALPLTIIFMFFLPLPDDVWNLPWRFWWPLLIIWFVLYPIQTHFFFKGMREGELSSVMPVTALLPVFSVAISFLLLGELPSPLGIVGIGLVVAGTYLVLKKKGTKMKQKPELYMIAATLCIAVGTTLDKISIQQSTPIFYAFMNTIGASVIFVILMYFYKQTGEFKKMKGLPGRLMLVGVLSGATYISAMFAFASGPVSYVLAVRCANFILPAIWGMIFLKEGFSPRKILALSFFTGGVALLAFA